MKDHSMFLLDVVFVAVVLLMGCAGGALMCFWPARWKMIQGKFPRAYSPDSPGGRMMERYRTKGATLMDRFGGFALLAMAVMVLAWFIQRFLVGKV